ncbi:uncharacterized protein PV09_06003 [Verruconis gallopava]|uniref:PCI domain-containing protein n=1 Tax=Verruconis gallopava TaxID=253628 RepID=A0A0D1YPK0_9PEZI|nr:uncharacterized protein PV09_06003 [Verruconis gallopava]KIW02547.1 hypothetical protein PV09_06003 [Verruconis gallopava]
MAVEDSIFFQEIRADHGKIVNDLPKFELESYVGNYEGILRLFKLRCIAHTSPPLSADAFRLLIQELKRGINVDMYMQVVEEFSKLLPSDPLAQVDTEWAETTARRVKTDTDRLERELKAYKNNLIKESIRMGQEDLGNHYFLVGDYPSAFKAYTKMREFCTTPKQIAQMTFKLLYVAIMQRNWAIAASYQPKMGALQLSSEEKAKFDPILFACVGLSHLQQCHYRDAARAFLNVDQQYMTLQEAQGGIVFQKQVMTPNDVAVYGGLCALATMDRAELQRRVLDNTTFRPLLELEPHIRRAISMFCSSKYKSCLQVLESYMADYLLDFYLNGHFLKLYQLVRSKCIVQWFSAYSSVTWQEIESHFPNNLLDIDLEDELRGMIRNGVLDARIDLVDKVLVSPNPDSRIAVIQDTLSMAKTTEHALRLRLHNINMRAAGLVVKSPNQGAMNLSMLAEQGSEFFNGAMGLRQGGGGAQGKIKKANGANMV